MVDNVIKISNYEIELDKILGLRALGLILYGALPSTLALLGALEVKIGQVNGLLPFLFLASILPIFIIFMLIRDRHKEWYLTIDSLNRRSAIITATILILATFISGISGIINNRYVIGIPRNLNEWTAIVESFLFGVVSIVISATFFITILTKEVNLPGLPSADFVKSQKKIRNEIREIKSSYIWKEYIPLDDTLINLAESVKQSLNDAFNLTGNNLAKKSLMPICVDITNFLKILKEIRGGANDESKKILWSIYFDEALLEKYQVRRSANKEKFDSIERLKELKLGD